MGGRGASSETSRIKSFSNWKKSGNQEAEFFAHMSESMVNKDARKMMHEIFPNASKAYERMVNDVLKSLKK